METLCLGLVRNMHKIETSEHMFCNHCKFRHDDLVNKVKIIIDKFSKECHIFSCCLRGPKRSSFVLTSFFFRVSCVSNTVMLRMSCCEFLLITVQKLKNVQATKDEDKDKKADVFSPIPSTSQQPHLSQWPHHLCPNHASAHTSNVPPR